MKADSDYYEAALRSAPDEQRLWLEDVINRLTGRPVFKCHEIKYWNHPELPESLRAQGYYVCYQSADRAGYPLYIMSSRSHTSEPLKLEEIVDDLRSTEIVLPFERFGEYYAKRKQRRGPGKYATIRFGARWYMLSVCGSMKPYYKLVETKKSAIRSEALTYAELRERQAALRAANR